MNSEKITVNYIVQLQSRTGLESYVSSDYSCKMKWPTNSLEYIIFRFYL